MYGMKNTKKVKEICIYFCELFLSTLSMDRIILPLQSSSIGGLCVSKHNEGAGKKTIFWNKWPSGNSYRILINKWFFFFFGFAVFRLEVSTLKVLFLFLFRCKRWESRHLHILIITKPKSDKKECGLQYQATTARKLRVVKTEDKGGRRRGKERYRKGLCNAHTHILARPPT